MKKIIFVFMLVCIAFLTAQDTYEQICENEYGLEITRIMNIHSENKIDQFRNVQTKLYDTNISLIIKNNGIPKAGIEIKDKIDYLPTNIKLQFYPNTEEKEGRVKWTFKNVRANEQLEMTINFKDTLDFWEFDKIPCPYIELHLKEAQLITPTIGRVGDEMLLTAITKDNEALPEIKISVISPSKKETIIQTDNRGVARFTPQENGEYNFDILDFKTNENYLVEVEQMINQDLTTANIFDNTINISDFIPLVVGLIMVAVLIFGMVLYFAPKNENGPKPEDWANAFGNIEDSEPEWMKEVDSFSESTIEKESSPLKEAVKTTTIKTKPIKKTKVEDIKTKTKKIIENRKKINANIKNTIKNKKTNAKTTSKSKKKPIKKKK
ncbi:hypothetical protein KO317_03070 [Candidatus Micrarchaeota archaeon]|nr:hypothetical protein [Candidatus Micrarchaeota archaeon]